jgi:hypothetical protein
MVSAVLCSKEIKCYGNHADRAINCSSVFRVFFESGFGAIFFFFIYFLSE